MDESDLKTNVLELLREKRLEDGECYHLVESLAGELNCTVAELYDWDNDSGVLYELSEDGDVQVLGNRKDGFCAIACIGSVEWGW